MDFTTFLTEGYKQSLDEKGFLGALRQHCANSHNAAKTSGLFTSCKSDEDFLLIDPVHAERATGFMIDSIAAELPSWRGFPDRRRSVIGYTSISVARHYSDADEKIYVMLPYDKGTLCLLHAKSFYVGFENGCKSLGIDNLSNGQLRGWLSSLRRVARTLGMSVSKDEPLSGKDFLKAVKQLEELKGKAKEIEGSKTDDEDKERAKAFAGRSGTAVEFLSHCLDPDSNRVEKLLAIHHNMPPEREAWTSSPCLLISIAAYKRLHEEGKIK